MVTDYPEAARLAEASKRTHPIGEFLDWLQGQGIQLMTWREDVADVRSTDPECQVRFDGDRPRSCDQVRDLGDGMKPRAWWRRHCLHWQDTRRDTSDGESAGRCCRCGKDQEYTITTEGWVPDQRRPEQLLADWAGIDLNQVEAERRRGLAHLQAANQS